MKCYIIIYFNEVLYYNIFLMKIILYHYLIFVFIATSKAFFNCHINICYMQSINKN